MTDVSRAAGVGPTVQIRGRTFTVNGYIQEHYATIHAEILKQRGNLMDLARGMARRMDEDVDEDGNSLLDHNLLYHLVERITEKHKEWNHVGMDERDRFLNETWEGFTLYCWLAVRHNEGCPQDLEEFRKWIARDMEDRQKAARQEARQKIEAAQERGESTADLEDPDVAMIRASAQYRANLQDVIEQAGGMDEMGNSTSSVSTTNPEAEASGTGT